MNTQQIVSELKRQRDALTLAIDSLEGTTTIRIASNGLKRRHMSAESRRKIGLAMKRAWAARKANLRVIKKAA